MQVVLSKIISEMIEVRHDKQIVEICIFKYNQADR